jgi:hypothetical protein
LIGTSGSAAHSNSRAVIDHGMKAMDTMSSYGDHQQVIGGIYENIHSMEVRMKRGAWEQLRLLKDPWFLFSIFVALFFIYFSNIPIFL